MTPAAGEVTSRHRYEAVVVAASAGGVAALGTLLAQLPPDFPLPVAIVQHRSPRHPHLLAKVLGRRSALPVKMAEEGEVLRGGAVYLAPCDLHMTVSPDRVLAFADGRRIRHVRSSANPLFESAAASLHGRVIAVVLTGYDSDGTDGVQAVKRAGGTVIAQDEATSQAFSMPGSAIATGSVDYVLPLGDIARALVRLAKVRA